MLRRTVAVWNKAPQAPGPALQGWGRTIQKRRLEHEAKADVSGKRKQMVFNEYFAAQERTTDAQAVRTYFNYPQRVLGFTFNWFEHNLSIFIIPTIMYGTYKYVLHWNAEVVRAAWW